MKVVLGRKASCFMVGKWFIYTIIQHNLGMRPVNHCCFGTNIGNNQLIWQGLKSIKV